MILGKRLSFLQGGPLHIQVQRPDLSEEKGTEMRRKSGGLREKNGGIRENAGGRKFQMTLFGGIVLVGLLVMTVKTRTGAEAVLLIKFGDNALCESDGRGGTGIKRRQNSPTKNSIRLNSAMI